MKCKKVTVMTLIKDIIRYLEEIAPASLQESYDNAGLIVGDHETQVTGVVVCLDSVEDTVDEAISLGANLIVAHHPIVFKGLKRFNGKNYVERTIIKAIKNDIAIYAIHTNIDSVLGGVSGKIAEKLGVKNCEILSPKTNRLLKLETYVPVNQVELVKNAMFEAGAGNVDNYANCSFMTEGKGTFKAKKSATPYVGEIGKDHTEAEIKIEVIFNRDKKNRVLDALLSSHPYEEVAYNILSLENVNRNEGLGVVGELVDEMNVLEFLEIIKSKMKAGVVRYTQPPKSTIKRVAICGGSGSFLLSEAKKMDADLFLTSDFKYHEFFDAENQIVIADIGHYESEQYTSELIYDFLTQKFSTFAVRISVINTNPVNYL